MKFIYIFLLLIFSISSFAAQMGGSIINEDHGEITARCHKIVDGECFSYKIILKKDGSEYTVNSGAIKNKCQKQFARGLYKSYVSELNEKFGAGYVAISLGIQEVCNKHSSNAWGCVIPAILSYPLNLPLMPFVGVAHGAARLSQLGKRRKYKKLVKLITTGPKNKSVKVTDKVFRPLSSMNIFTIFRNKSDCIHKTWLDEEAK